MFEVLSLVVGLAGAGLVASTTLLAFSHCSDFGLVMVVASRVV
jgi:hypothetical protein